MSGDVSPERSGQRPAFRFAAGGPLMLDLPALSEHARKVEDLGFSTLFVSEHVGEQLAPLPAMMAAALATTRLRVGSLVFNAGHHNPVLLAQQAASADLLTSGRLEVGLGAGWYGPDYELMKLRFGSAAERIDQLAQTASIVRRLLSAESGGPPNADPAAASDSRRLASQPARPTPPPARRPACRSSSAAGDGGCSRSLPGTPTSSTSRPVGHGRAWIWLRSPPRRRKPNWAG